MIKVFNSNGDVLVNDDMYFGDRLFNTIDEVLNELIHQPIDTYTLRDYHTGNIIDTINN